MIEGSYAPRPWAVMGDADWEAPRTAPPGKRHPYPDELELLDIEARRIAGTPRYNAHLEVWRRRVSRLFYALCVDRGIYIEGM